MIIAHIKVHLYRKYIQLLILNMFLGKTDIHRYMNMKLNKVRSRNVMGAKYPKVCKPFLKVCFDGRTPRGDLSEKKH